MKIFYSNIVIGIIAVFLFAGALSAQTEKNIDILSKMIDESILDLSEAAFDGNERIHFNFSSHANYSVFKNRCLAAINTNEYQIVTSVDEAEFIVEYSLNTAEINYKETFRDGLFGDYFVERNAEIKGSYSISKNKSVLNAENFEYSKIDTVAYNEIKSLENYSLPFTQGKIPPEPFFSSIWEPIIAVGTAIVTIYLFFTVRSK